MAVRFWTVEIGQGQGLRKSYMQSSSGSSVRTSPTLSLGLGVHLPMDKKVVAMSIRLGVKFPTQAAASADAHASTVLLWWRL